MKRQEWLRKGKKTEKKRKESEEKRSKNERKSKNFWYSPHYLLFLQML
ncbi:MAG: hypothetical protein UCO54_12090 [Segatella copri]|nr:hypothetical protein [Segatella copri]